MPSALENLAGPDKALRKEPPDAKEFSGLKRSALARLRDAGKPDNSLESRFDLGYNAAHALCLAALRWHGYRAAHRYIVFQVCRIPWAWDRRYGGYSPSATMSAIRASTRAI